MNFFKKLSPDTAVVYQGQSISFTTLDQLTGYYATVDPNLTAFLKGCIERQQYGMSEISEDEFHRDYVEPKKKGLVVPPKSQWQREQMGASGLERGRGPLSVLDANQVASAVAVERRVNGHSPETAMEEPLPAPKPIAPKAPDEIKPTVGKRNVKKKAD